MRRTSEARHRWSSRRSSPSAPRRSADQAPTAPSVTVKVPSSVATQAAWLFKSGWPLYALVDKFATDAQLDEQTDCLATAVYFVSGRKRRGPACGRPGGHEPRRFGALSARLVQRRQAAVAILVRQSAQRPAAAAGHRLSRWRKAEAVAELAAANVVPSVDTDVLLERPMSRRRGAAAWRWCIRFGAHIFYRA